MMRSLFNKRSCAQNQAVHLSSARRRYCTPTQPPAAWGAPAAAATSEPSLQELLRRDSVCYGCGPANEHGLRLRSFLLPPPKRASNFPGAYHAVSVFTPQPHHVGVLPNAVNGGVLATVLDCHCNILAAYTLLRLRTLYGISGDKGSAPSNNAMSFEAMERALYTVPPSAAEGETSSMVDAASPVDVREREGGSPSPMIVTAEMNLRLVQPTPMAPLRIYGAVDLQRSLELHREKQVPVGEWTQLHVSAVCAPLGLEHRKEGDIGPTRHMCEETFLRMYCIPVPRKEGEKKEGPKDYGVPQTTNIMSLATVDFSGLFVAVQNK